MKCQHKNAGTRQWPEDRKHGYLQGILNPAKLTCAENVGLLWPCLDLNQAPTSLTEPKTVQSQKMPPEAKQGALATAESWFERMEVGLTLTLRTK